MRHKKIFFKCKNLKIDFINFRFFNLQCKSSIATVDEVPQNIPGPD